MSKDKIIEEWDLHRERARATGIFLHKEVAAFFTGSNMKGSFRFTFNVKYYQADEIINIEKEESLFRQFISQNPLQVYRTNFLVADSTWRLAGRVAFIGKCSDGYVLYDWKRRNGITDKYGNAITENAFDQKGTNGLENIWDTRKYVQLRISEPLTRIYFFAAFSAAALAFSASAIIFSTSSNLLPILSAR